ncbi:MAG TPA: GNAT family N-acetyltransferase [Nitriliruptorales bacterium]|nr:GNAT family N-acetyltransferase [Nitriliruptorales bacterium]
MPDVQTEQRFPDGALTDDWLDLVALDPAASVFHSARFLRLWSHHLRGDRELRLRFVRDGEVLLGVVPEVRDRTPDGRRMIQFAGGEHVTDYLGPISRPQHRDLVAGAWIDTLASEDDWDELIAGGLAEDAGWHQPLIAHASRARLEVCGDDVEDVCPRIDLSGGWDAYLQRLSGKHRHEIRRKARKLAREGGVVKLIAVDPEDLDDALTIFLELNRRLEDDKGRFFVADRMEDFFRALTYEFGPDRTLRMHRLDIDGAPAAVTVSLVGDGVGDKEWGLYNSAFERGYGALAPGVVLVGEVIRIAADEGYAGFDLLRGDEPYKYRFGARDRPLRRVTVVPAAGTLR